ncbi:plectin-like [Tigriopus californicus]|uniref:plectin-like n=1 Tax=Tigriopus californicus TaxID=6832 RepID=UPI0027DAB3D4|nr:plectin-like [Tigriopus californicus]
MMQEILADLENLDEIPEDILEELQREIARNEEANRLAKQREVEAKAARDRAAQSKAMMSTMEERYLDIQNKVETTRQTLSEAKGKLERQNKLTEDLEHLKQMVEHAADQARPSETANLTSTSDILNSLPSNGLPSKKVDYASIVKQLQTKLAVQDCEERSEQVERQRAANEIAATVRRLEEKSANVKAKIEQIALYEESLKTRRAQLMATKREREALKAVEEAKKKEEEALVRHYY